MDQDKTLLPQDKEKKDSKLRFLYDMLAGYGIGIAFIIPGFSGGSLAAIFGIYERLIGAIADIFRDFKRSVVTLLPIFIGLALGAVSLLYPLRWALSAFPLPTVALFVGLALGGMPSITNNMKGRIEAKNVAAFAIPALLVLGLCFAPTGADMGLLDLNFGGYLLLFAVGILGSSALVIPGISGSMILLILGYYNPLVKIITDHLFRGEDVGVSLLVLACAGLGIAVGFVGISVIMKQLLSRYKRGTYFAITGFIIGSIPSVFVSASKDAGYTLATLPQSPWHWIVCALLLIAGAAISLALVLWSRGRSAAERSE